MEALKKLKLELPYCCCSDAKSCPCPRYCKKCNLEGWDEVGDGRGVQEGRAMCTPMADSC